MLRVCIVACLLIMVACGEDTTSSPTAPSPVVMPPPPRIAQVAGHWTGTTTTDYTSVAGGGCVGRLLREEGGIERDDFTLTIRQTGDRLTGTYFDVEDSNSCEFTGSVSGSTVDLAVNVESCTIVGVDLTDIPGCSPGLWRVRSSSMTLNGTVSGSSMSGTYTTRAAVSHAGSVYPLAISGQFTGRR